jgi:hypothetical protein
VSARAGAALTLAGIVLAAAALWGGLGRQLEVPTVFGDELIHWDASRSLAAGDGLRVREGGYGFGPVYPALAAPVHALAGDDLTAYGWARLLNAALFALAAVPAYLLARRLLPSGWSLACAALTVAVPSALYTGFVMTEGAAYAACTLALLAFARCLERPTVPAQLAALGTLALAAGVRLQLAALGVALVAALGLRALLTRLPRRRELARLWPLLLVLGVGAAALALRAALGNPLGGYGDLWRSYDAVEVARWTWRSLAGLGVYLAVVPLVVAPAALVALARDARRGDRAAAAFVPLFLAVNGALLLVVGAFSSTEFGIGFLHDRYLFYVVPLWLVATAVWAERHSSVGLPGLALGAALALVLLATLPPYLLNADGGRRFDAVASALPSELAELLGRSQPARWMLVLAGLGAVVVVLALAQARRARWLALALVALVFALDAGFAWDARLDAATNVTFGRLDSSTTAWVDDVVPEEARVATLAGSVPLATRDALRLTEFFNGSIGPAYDLGAGYAPTLASEHVRVAGGGVLVTDTGPVDAGWVVASPELELAGEVVAVGTLARLRLWRVSPPVRLAGGAEVGP